MSKFIGSVLLLIGTALGAGMLALPIVASAVGFFWAAILVIVIWGVMTYTALLTLEVNLAFPAHRNNFSTMAAKTLGLPGKMLVWSSCLFLLYALTAAYIAGDASLLSAGLTKVLSIHVKPWFCALLFTIVLGSAVFWSTKAVDILNRGLFSIKGVLLCVTLGLLVPHIDVASLARSAGAAKYLWACIPVFLCAFGFHTVIPSLSNYIGQKSRSLKWIIILGATVPLLVYILWLFMTLAIIPLFGKSSFHSLTVNRGSVGGFVNLLIVLAHSKLVAAGINGFSNVAMTTSFLGVSLGLFDFLADAFKRVNTRVGRLQTSILTFIPPLLFAIYYPHGFVMALGYAAIFVAILEIILPVAMVYRLRKDSKLCSSYRVFGGHGVFLLVLLVGVLVIVTQVLNTLHLLPML